MKKAIMAITAAVAVMAAGSASACPEWECQLDLNDYSCGGVHGCITQGYEYNEYSTTTRQAIYCQYCGHEQWDCICGTYSGGGCVDYDVDYNSGYVDYDYDCNDNYNYSCSGGQMSHWANIRDCNGNIIGQAGCGDSVEVIGTDSSDSSRVLIYDRSTGCYGSVLASCVYGGYEWDGSGDNGYYNQYQGGCNGWDYSGAYDCDDYYDDCGYADAVDCSGYSGGYQICAAYSTTTYTQIVQTIVEQVSYSMGLRYGGSCGFKGWC